MLSLLFLSCWSHASLPLDLQIDVENPDLKIATHPEELRKVFRPVVAEFNAAQLGYCVVDSDRTTYDSGMGSYDVSQYRGLVGPEDQAYATQTACASFVPTAPLMIDYHDSYYTRVRAEFEYKNLLRLPRRFLGTSLIMTDLARRSLSKHDVNTQTVFQTEQWQQLRKYDVIVIAASDENLFGRYGAYGEALNRSSENALEIFALEDDHYETTMYFFSE